MLAQVVAQGAAAMGEAAAQESVVMAGVDAGGPGRQGEYPGKDFGGGLKEPGRTRMTGVRVKKARIAAARVPDPSMRRRANSSWVINTASHQVACANNTHSSRGVEIR